jgi:hypothetical protein
MILGFIPSEVGGSIPAIFERRTEGWRVLKRLSVPADGAQHARPFITNTGGKGLFAIWCEILDYHGSPYTNWKSRIVGAIMR